MPGEVRLGGVGRRGRDRSLLVDARQVLQRGPRRRVETHLAEHRRDQPVPLEPAGEPDPDVARRAVGVVPRAVRQRLAVQRALRVVVEDRHVQPAPRQRRPARRVGERVVVVARRRRGRALRRDVREELDRRPIRQAVGLDEPSVPRQGPAVHGDRADPEVPGRDTSARRVEPGHRPPARSRQQGPRPLGGGARIGPAFAAANRLRNPARGIVAGNRTIGGAHVIRIAHDRDGRRRGDLRHRERSGSLHLAPGIEHDDPLPRRRRGRGRRPAPGRAPRRRRPPPAPAERPARGERGGELRVGDAAGRELLHAVVAVVGDVEVAVAVGGQPPGSLNWPGSLPGAGRPSGPILPTVSRLWPVARSNNWTRWFPSSATASAGPVAARSGPALEACRADSATGPPRAGQPLGLG